MNGTGEHYAKLNKPVDERQILYDLTYKRNLMNQVTNGHNRTRDLETGDKLTAARGKGGAGKWWKEREKTS